MASSSDRRPATWPVFQAPFRIFFISSALSAVLLIPIWLVLFYHGGGAWMPIPPLLWHEHEMLAGFLEAAIAGFILTAVANWTRTPLLHGAPLVALWLLWLAGRVAMAMGGPVPGLAATVDLSFMPVLALIVAARVARARQARQIVLVAVLAAFWVLDLLFHCTGAPRFLHAMVLLAAALIVIIGGRITPAFTANWLMREQGPESAAAVRRFPWLDRLAMAACLALVLFEALGWRFAGLVAPVAALAALAVLVRLWGWSGWRAGKDPLLWILHVGHVWIVLGLCLRALAAMGEVGDSAWLHALGAGAMATMILAVMTRVSVAHTGRPLRLLPGARWAYVAVLVAGGLRVAIALQWLPFREGVWSVAAAWTAAFLIFLWCYSPLLLRRGASG